MLATDLEKPVEQLVNAYDDEAGVTAAFNMNYLARLNRELGADFDLEQFEHVARYDENERRVEMHLRSKAFQRVSIPAAGLKFYMREGETIWTESSHKYNPKEVVEMIKTYIAEGNNPDQPGRLIQWLYPRTPVHTWKVPGTWFDIGSKETLEEADRIFRK